MLITYTYYHSDSKATPCGFSNVSIREATKIYLLFLYYGIHLF
jgi:hypothetical protein